VAPHSATDVQEHLCRAASAAAAYAVGSELLHGVWCCKRVINPDVLVGRGGAHAWGQHLHRHHVPPRFITLVDHNRRQRVDASKVLGGVLQVAELAWRRSLAQHGAVEHHRVGEAEVIVLAQRHRRHPVQGNRQHVRRRAETDAAPRWCEARRAVTASTGGAAAGVKGSPIQEVLPQRACALHRCSVDVHNVLCYELRAVLQGVGRSVSCLAPHHLLLH
jgi:hypothetical protein